MNEISAKLVTIQDAYWTPRQQVNARQAIFHQWQELEKSGCIDNFRILCGEREGFREGWVFADSDAYKWLEAAARIYFFDPNPRLKESMDELIRLMAATQMQDGYIYTFNQFHFPGQRWVNMQIEHELYCHGHLIEAAISHHEATGENGALNIAIKAADLLARTFMNGPAAQTDGHEEIEIGLLRLSQVTGRTEYLDLARHFIEVRGRIAFFPFLYQRENTSYAARKAIVNQQRAVYASRHPEYAVTRIPPDNESKLPRFSKERRKLEGWSGRYIQQHVPVRQQTVPYGHAVRYGYFQTATAMLYRMKHDSSLLPALQASWEQLITRKMYVTGGLGALPGNEGFGYDYELDPEFAYNETCAALASLFWNWEMTLATGNAQHSDLFEWQLYNAAAVGMGLDGSTYLYNNPLCVHDGILRRSWYSVPCCPSNLSRTWAWLGKYIYSFDADNLWVHQYIGSQAGQQPGMPASITVESSLPFEGTVRLKLATPAPAAFSLHLRLPSWVKQVGALPKIRINGDSFQIPADNLRTTALEATAQGYDPRTSSYLSIKRTWQPGDEVVIEFPMEISARRAHPRVKNHTGKAAFTRGPLVYCLESVENPGLDIFNVKVDAASLTADTRDTALGRITVLSAKSNNQQNLTFIPYHLWGNRGPSQMVVWVNA